MSNQSDSQNGGPSSGSTSPLEGPIGLMWSHFLEFNQIMTAEEGPTTEQLELGKFIHYTCAMQMYNAFISALRAPDPRPLLVLLTEAMKKDMDTYFKDGKTEIKKSH